MNILVGTQRDLHHTDCDTDTVETVIYVGSEVITELDCCGTQEEYMPGDFADLVSEG